jgi:hypothetical protein
MIPRGGRQLKAAAVAAVLIQFADPLRKLSGLIRGGLTYTNGPPIIAPATRQT